MKKLLFFMTRSVNYLLHWVFCPFLAFFCLLSRFVPKRYDVGLGPLPLINNVYWAQALRQQGYSVQTFVNDTYYITEDFDLTFNHGWKRIFFICPALSFMRCLVCYKCIYVYFNGGPLQLIPGLRLLEPRLFRLAGVKTVVMPYGSDCQIFERTPNKLMTEAMCRDYPSYFQKNHGRLVRQVEAWSRGGDIVVGAMDSIDYLFFWNRTRLCHYAINTGAYTPVYPAPKPGQTIKIMHAPNHKAVKGSGTVLMAVETLQAEGYPVELIFKQGVPNKEFLEIVKQADIVVDQLVIGCYAMFAMEAMSFGKPTICYMRSDLLETFENIGCIEHGEIPLINAQPHTILDVLRRLLDNPQQLAEIGKKSREYVVKYHSLAAVGAWLDEINHCLGVEPHFPGEKRR